MTSLHKPGAARDGMGVCPIVRPEKLADRRQAVRVAASLSRDAADCAMVLEMLGLDPKDGKEAT